MSSTKKESEQTPMNLIAESEVEKHLPTNEIDEVMILRKRRGWENINPDFDIPEESSDDDELVEEDEAGCPLPSTPEDTQLIEAEVSYLLFFCCVFNVFVLTGAANMMLIGFSIVLVKRKIARL